MTDLEGALRLIGNIGRRDVQAEALQKDLTFMKGLLYGVVHGEIDARDVVFPDDGRVQLIKGRGAAMDKATQAKEQADKTEPDKTPESPKPETA